MIGRQQDGFLPRRWRCRLIATGGLNVNFDTAAAKYRPAILSLLRIISGLMLFQYGVAKILKIPAESPFAKVQVMSLVGAAGLIELILGALFIVGLFTRPIAFILCGEMAFAYFIAHFPKSFFPVVNNGTASIVFCFLFLYFVFAGPGPVSLDAALRKKGGPTDNDLNR